MAKEEFVGLKLLIARMFKDKIYLSLWELMLTREPYCSDYKNILHLVHILLVLPVSSAVCERGFSSQKRIKSDARASLHTDTVEDLIRISVEGPSLEDFDARESVANWFSQGRQEGQITGVGHLRGMYQQEETYYKTLEDFSNFLF